VFAYFDLYPLLFSPTLLYPPPPLHHLHLHSMHVVCVWLCDSLCFFRKMMCLLIVPCWPLLLTIKVLLQLKQMSSWLMFCQWRSQRRILVSRLSPVSHHCDVTTDVATVTSVLTLPLRRQSWRHSGDASGGSPLASLRTDVTTSVVTDVTTVTSVSTLVLVSPLTSRLGTVTSRSWCVQWVQI